MNPVYKERLRETALGVALVALLGFGGYVGHSYVETNDEMGIVNNQIRSARSSDEHLVRKAETPKYVVNAQGSLDYHAQKTISAIRDVFMNDFSFTNGKQYASNRSQFKQFIKDPKFYKQFMKPYIDSSGDSEIDALHEKAKFDNAKVYEVEPGKYLVIVNYYLYHNPKDFEVSADNLPVENSEFLMTGDSVNISHVSVIGKPLIQ